MKARERIMIGVVIIVVAIMSVFLGFKKVGYNLDEIWNYGLANHVGGITPNIERGQEYSGMGPFEDYIEVNSGQRFNYVNVWKNQAADVHPPLYYIIFHTVCSFFPNTFSKWYGIVVNILWMIAIMYLLYKLAKEITGSEFMSFGIILAYGTSVIFLNTIMFIRMYTQFAFFTIALSYLIKHYWDKELDKKFYILFSVIIVLGMLTHYYFLIFSFFICVCFAINLKMNRKYKELRTSIFTAAGSGIFYLIIWYHIGGHLFRGYRGRQAISQALSFGGLFKGAKGLFKALNEQGFWGLLLAFAIALAVLILLKFKKKEKLWGFEAALLLSCLLYVLVVGKIAPFTTSRYVMCTAFGFILIGYLIISELVTVFAGARYASCIALIVFLIINTGNLISRGFCVPNCYHNEELISTMNYMEDKEAVVYINEDWNSFCFFEPLLHAKSYCIVDENTAQDVFDSKKDYMLLTYTSEPESVIEGLDAELLYKTDSSYYFYVH